ncbi:MAG: BLUF domain-containing protein [Porticoccaceae bacterium]
MQIRQVIYRSKKASGFPESEIQSMFQNFKTPNTTYEITGILFYIDGNFIQCLEGSEANIEQLLSNIIHDPRNTALTILSDSMVKGRRFPTWWMGFRNMSANELMQQKGFVDISRKETLEGLLSHYKEMLNLMIDFYDSEQINP